MWSPDLFSDVSCFSRVVVYIVEGGNGVEAAESSSSKVSLALDFGSVTLCKSKV